MGDKRKPGKIDPDQIDPSIYYYDEYYDDDKEAQSKELPSSSCKSTSKDTGSKYITKIKEEADLRRTEKDVRKFKRYARDRLVEDHGNEEVFVTSSYKKKLAEIAEIEKSLKIDRREQSDDIEKPDQSRDMNKLKEQIEPKSQSMTTSKIAPKQLKSIDDRREYLRQVLAKRTVGKVYLDAVQRYKQRKLRTS